MAQPFGAGISARVVCCEPPQHTTGRRSRFSWQGKPSYPCVPHNWGAGAATARRLGICTTPQAAQQQATTRELVPREPYGRCGAREPLSSWRNDRGQNNSRSGTRLASTTCPGRILAPGTHGPWHLRSTHSLLGPASCTSRARSYGRHGTAWQRTAQKEDTTDHRHSVSTRTSETKSVPEVMVGRRVARTDATGLRRARLSTGVKGQKGACTKMRDGNPARAD